MATRSIDHPSHGGGQPDGAARLRTYYLVRAGVAAAWVGLALTIGRSAPVAGAILLIAYPAWDALANWADAAGNGGLTRNRTQAINIAVSLAATVAIAVLIGNLHAVLGVFGVWAMLAGAAQLATGVRRWRTVGAQWAMILSGAQSVLAGGFMLSLAFHGGARGAADVAPYAGFGAFYFLVSAIALSLPRRR
jgi:uncharacterized membrane protein HdeD (DUF308 family)